MIGGFLTATSGGATAASGDPYMDASLPVADRVSDLMSRMSLDDKIGQMTQADRVALGSSQDVTRYRLGSVLSGGNSGPSDRSASGWAQMYDDLQRAALNTELQIPMIFGVDAVHGHNNVAGATVFPHNIGLGATRDPDLLQRIGQVTAKEVAATGVDWTFAPCLCVARNDRWGRTYESYGEKPEIGSSLTTLITGLQTERLGSTATSIMATAKHYIGDGGTTNGVDQGNTELSESELRAIHLPPFEAAIEKGVGSVMVSYNSINGQKMHGHRYLITDVLKGELGFDGFVVSDWAGIDQLDGDRRSFTAAEVAQGINAGIDMVMVPNDYAQFISYLRQNVQNGQVSQSRIDDAVRRILTKKFELGLFERPYADRTLVSVVGSSEHRAVAREAVRKSVVLLKNQDNVLPLAPGNQPAKIFVAGKNAHDIGLQNGGWTLSWQGEGGNHHVGTSILDGIRQAASRDGNATVTYDASGSGINSSYDVAIAVVGETPYAEGEGDLNGSMGLDSRDLQVISQLRSAGVPVVVVLISGRPLDVASELGNWAGLVAAWLPGSEGGGVADVLFGEYNPTGKLPVTWMRSASQQPINDGDGKDALFPFGYGLSYQTTTTTTSSTTTRTSTSTTSTTSSTSTTPTSSSSTRTTVTCQPSAPTVVGTTTNTIWFYLSESSCLAGDTYRLDLYASLADAQAGSPVVASGEGAPGTTVAIRDLSEGTQYWYRVNDAAQVFGPARTRGTATSSSTTTRTSTSSTTTSTTTSTSSSTTSTTPSRTTTTSTSSTSPTSTSTTSSTSSTRTTPSTSTTPTAGGGCTATYRVVSEWPGGFQGEVTVRNNGSGQLSGWTVGWTYANGQTIQQLWNASHAISGATVTVKNASWNGALGGSASTNFGFIGTWNGTNSVPAVSCSGG